MACTRLEELELGNGRVLKIGYRPRIETEGENGKTQRIRKDECALEKCERYRAGFCGDCGVCGWHITALFVTQSPPTSDSESRSGREDFRRE